MDHSQESCSAGGSEDYSDSEDQGLAWRMPSNLGHNPAGALAHYAAPGATYGRARRAAWTSDEERRLAQLAARYSNAGQRMCWRIIAQELNTGRTSKQCREHYLNSLRPNMKKGGWTQREEYVIAREHSRIGSHWCIIAKRLPGRTDNSIKNFFNATVRSKAINKTESILWLYVDRLRNGRQPKEAFVEACEVWSAYMPAAVVQEVMNGKSGKTASQNGSGQSSGLHMSSTAGPNGELPRSHSFSNMDGGMLKLPSSPHSAELQAMQAAALAGTLPMLPVQEGAEDGAEALMLLSSLAGKGNGAGGEGGDEVPAGLMPAGLLPGLVGSGNLPTRASRTSSGTEYNAAKAHALEVKAEREESEVDVGERQSSKRRKIVADMASTQQLLATGAPSLGQLGGGALPMLNPGLQGLGGPMGLDALQQLQLQQILASAASPLPANQLSLPALLQQLGAQQLLAQQAQTQGLLLNQLGGSNGAGLLGADPNLVAMQNANLQQQLLQNASLLQALEQNNKQLAQLQGGSNGQLVNGGAQNSALAQLAAGAPNAAALQQLAAGNGTVLPGQQQYIIITVPGGVVG